MPPFDLSFFINTIFVAAVGSFFGSVVGAWVTHYYQRKRDDIVWERDRKKLEEQFKHDVDLVELQFQNRVSELEQQFQQQQRSQLRNEITKGIETPEKAIQALQAVTDIQHIVDELNGRQPSEIQIRFVR